MNNTDQFPLPDDDIPPLEAGEDAPQTCSTVRLYLAILDDLPPEQAQLLLEHVRTCPACAAVHRLMQQTTHMLAGLPDSAPSSRVDQAVMTAIAARSSKQIPANAANRRDTARIPIPPISKKAEKRRRSIVGAPLAGSLVALAAVLILAFLMTTHFLGGSTTQAFALPANLSWNGYVLYHSEKRIADHGERYQVDSYHDLSTGRMHVETMMDSSLDVVAVGNDQTMLGLDMMHHVAQWGADAWSVDESVFNLAELRSDLAAHRAVYLDEDMFRGQPVYRIRTRNGLVLLLDMRYQPVNVLRGAIGPGTGAPIYDSLMLMPASHVSSSMWDMSIPVGFRMGTLPPKP